MYGINCKSASNYIVKSVRGMTNKPPMPKNQKSKHKTKSKKRNSKNKEHTEKVTTESVSAEPSDTSALLKAPEQPERSTTPEITEYYPQKKKRHSPKKKTILKYKLNLKDIKQKNKRKSFVPRKGTHVEWKDPNRIEFSELSIFEIICFLEENGLLDDETIEEITDCPSPVWWEDAPNDDYCEDPIERELVMEALEGMRESPPPLEEDVEIRVQLLKKQLKTDDKFFKKKDKLDSILGNIKNRVLGNDVKVEPKGEWGNDREQKFRLSESSDGDILSDISFNEEQLKNLETIEIPVKNTDIKDEPQPAVPETLPPLQKFPYQSANERRETVTESIKSKICTITSSEADNAETNSRMSPRIFDTIESSKSASFSDDGTSGEFDSISDTNVRFLDDEDVDLLTGNIEDVDDAMDIDLPMETDSDKTDLVTVYNIVSELDTETKPHTYKSNVEEYKIAKAIFGNFIAKSPNYESTDEVAATKNVKPLVDFISMPRNIANQRKLNLCDCGNDDCVCFNLKYDNKTTEKTSEPFVYRNNHKN